MKRAIVLGVVVVLPLWACAKSPPNGSSSTGGSGGARNGGNTPNTGGVPSTGGVCNVSIPSEAGATCDLESPLDAGVPLDAGPASDLTKAGPYAVGHVNLALSDSTLYARPVMVGVWYPVDPGTIAPATPPAQYPLDVWTNTLPVATSRDWETLGYDPAYEAPAPSRNGPFPLVMVSPGLGGSHWGYLYVGTRLASHGFVVAVTDHYGDGQYPWSSADDNVLFNRTRDVSFAITELLQQNDTVGELLYGAMDPSKIAMSGHSVGGYATLALAGGDDYICHTELAADGGQSQQACAPSPPDPRIKAIVALDPSSWAMRYYEMARVSVPSLIIGETVEHMMSYSGESSTGARENARTHAAINRGDSHRVDVTLANHVSFSNGCDGHKVMSNMGVDASTLISIYGFGVNSSSSVCGTFGGFDPTTNPATRRIVTTYMLAFLNTYLWREDDSWMLTSSYARKDQPNVEFFAVEACDECPVGDGDFSYRPHPCQCSVGQKEPP
jgi:predicted dienelactone hydrolase